MGDCATTTIVDSPERAKAVLRKLQQREGPFGFDTETIGVDPRSQSPVGRGKVACWSLALADRDGRMDNPISGLVHRVFLWGSALPTFAPWLETAPLVGHNVFTFDRQIMLNHGIELRNIRGDTLRMSKLYRSDKRVDHSLKGMGKYWLGRQMSQFTHLFSRPKQLGPEVLAQKKELTRRKVDGRMVPTLLNLGGEVSRFSPSATDLIPLDLIPTLYPERLPQLYEYATLDAEITLRLYWLLREKLGGQDAV